MKIQPPQLALMFFRWFCRRDLRDHIEGDLLEFFDENVHIKGPTAAKRIFIYEIIKLLHPRIIRFFYSGLKLNFLGMSKLNFLLALRRMKRNRVHALINIFGLTVGLVAVTLMLLYINYESSYDQFDDRLFRVERIYQTDKVKETWNSTPYPLAAELINKIPEVQEAFNLRKTSNYLVVNEAVFLEKNGLFADQPLLQLFPFNLIKGNPKTALSSPGSILLSSTLAHKLFPEGNYLEQTISLDKTLEVKVTGVFEDFQQNSHLEADYILSFETIGNYGLDSWQGRGSVCYIQLNNSSRAAQVETQIASFLDNYLTQESYYTETLQLRPVSDIYLQSSRIRGGLGKSSERTVIYLFLAVAIFTSLITALNYMNASSAELINRDLEIGIKKVMGSSRGNFALQFMIEALLVAVIGFILALGITFVSLPFYNELVNKPLTLSLITHWSFLLKIFGFTMMAGIIVGLYPTLYLSALKVSNLITGNSTVRRKSTARKALVTFQLIISMPLIFTAILMSEQINYLQNRDIGFNKHNLARTRLTVNSPQMDQKLRAFKEELLQESRIIDCSITQTGPYHSGNSMNVSWQDGSQEEHVMLRTHDVDEDFTGTYKMEIVEGRNFNDDLPSDAATGLIINETTKRYFKWNSAVGKRLSSNGIDYRIIGVVKDFNDYTMFKRIPPMALRLRTQVYDQSLVSVRVSGNPDESLQFLNTVFNETFPQEPIQFELLTNDFDRSYLSSLDSVSKVFIFFSALAIFLAALGLYSLVSFATQLQQKMIAIRKVLGAGITGLFTMLLKEYLLLFLIAAVLGLLSTYFIAIQVMDVMAYHTTVKISYLLIGGAISLGVVLASVSAKIFFTTRANPVDSISRE